MTSARHRQVVAHPLRRRVVRLAVPAAAAALLTGAIVAVAVGTGGNPGAEPRADVAAAARTPMRATFDPADSPYLASRIGTFSRSAKRVTLEEKPEVKDTEFMTTDLNLWPSPKEKGKPLDVLHGGDKVAVTGLVRGGFAQILHDGQVRWVNADYLSDEKPKPPEPADSTAAAPTAGVSGAPCPDGSGTESGLTPSAVTMFRAVCNAFPALTTYGGYDNHGEHSSGRAVDFMVSDSGLGQAVADWARAHAAELNLYDILWAQHIWTPVRASEGWRSLPDRGSATANHYDHVHISVN